MTAISPVPLPSSWMSKKEARTPGPLLKWNFQASQSVNRARRCENLLVLLRQGGDRLLFMIINS